jgi:hypothetical protein
VELCGKSQLHGRRDATQSHIGPFVVVRPEPVSRCGLDLFDGIEQGLREPVVAHGPIVAFDVRVLLRLSRLDKIEVNAAHLRPLLHRHADVRRSIVVANDGRGAAPFDQLVERSDDASCRS